MEKVCRVTAGKKMIAIAHAMAMAVPKPPADPLAARGCPASMRSGRDSTVESDFGVCFITGNLLVIGPITFAWGGRRVEACATRDDEPRPVWTSLPITH